MRVIPPIEIDDAALVSSTAAEPHAPAAYSGATTYAADDIRQVAADFTIYQSLRDGNLNHTPNVSPTWWRDIGYTETAYNGATTYGVGDTVSSTTTHRIYESLQAGNVGNALPVLPETETAWWLDVGPTNRWAMFDLDRNTQTVFASPLTVVIRPDTRVNAIGLVGLEATSVTITMDSAAGSPVTNYYTATEALSTREVASWYEYFFTPFETRTSLALFNLPPRRNVDITVTIINTGGNVRCGGLILGAFEDLGSAEQGVGLRRLSFSSVTTDTFGETKLTRRRNVPTTEQTIKIDAARLKHVEKVIADLDAVPALYSTLDDADHLLFEPLLILGIQVDADFTVGDPWCFLRLKLKEL